MIKKIHKRILNFVLVFSILSASFFLPSQKAEAIDLSSVLKGVAIGYSLCWVEGTIYSLPSLLEDILSVPTGSIGGKGVSAASGAKDCGFDYAANMLKQELIHGILKSTTEWVKGGYNGKPSFLTNPDQFLEEATDQYVANIIENNESTKFLCDSFQIPLKFAINLKFYNKERPVPTCTMSDIERNIDNALGDLENFYTPNGELDSGSFWNSFINTSTNSGNNVYGAYIELSDDLERQINDKAKKKLDDVRTHGGFMSIERCDGENDGTYAGDVSNRICGQKYTECMSTAKTDDEKELCSARTDKCIRDSIGKQNCEYVTPGTVVAEEVSSVLGMERENLQLADEFDELISAVITQLMSKVFDSNKGLSGINRSGDGGDYESAEKKDISAEKAAMLKQYNPRAYDIQLRIYQSILDAIEPQQTNFDPMSLALEEEKYWSGKDDLMLETTNKVQKYWSAAGYNAPQTQNWESPLVSYLTAGKVRPIFKNSKIINAVSDNSYIKSIGSAKKGSIICSKINNNEYSYCAFVVAVNENSASVLRRVSVNKNGKVGGTLKRVSVLLNSNTIVFTPVDDDSLSDKYNDEYYQKLYGDDYKRIINKQPLKNDVFQKSIEAWEKFKERYKEPGGGRTTLFWADGFLDGYEVVEKDNKVITKDEDGNVKDIQTEKETKKYLKHNMNFQVLPESVVDEAIKALKLNSLSGDKIDNIRRLRDETIRDREEANRVSEEIKRATTIQELWDIGGSNVKADPYKAYNIYKDIKRELSNSILGVPAIGPRGESGYKGGLVTLAAIPLRKESKPWRWTTVDEKIKEEAVPDGAKGSHWHIHIKHDQPFTLDDLKDIVVKKDEVSQFQVSEIKFNYDPTDDLRDLSSGIYDNNDYDFNSF